MIENVNHIAIAVNNLKEAIDKYENMLGAKVSKPIEQPEHGVSVAFVELSNVKIELLEMLGDESPIKNFLRKNPNGGIHHICYDVKNIQEIAKKLQKNGALILNEGKTKIGAHGKPVLFIHPKNFNGTLIELQQM